MKRLIYLTTVFLTVLTLGSCSGDEAKHTPKYNMIARIENPAMIASYDFMRLMDKSDIQNSDDLPMEIKFLMGMYIDKTFNSSNMGIKLEGNNHVVVAATDENEFEAAYIFAEVVNAGKVKKGLKDFMSGKYEEKEGFHFLEDKNSPAIAVWDTTHIVLAFSENEELDLRSKVKDLLDNRFEDAEDNKPLEDYLSREDDMNMMMFLDTYYKLINKEAKEPQLDEEMIEAYKGGYVIAYGNFNPGSIVFESEIHAENAKNTKYNIFSDKGISPSFMNYLTDNDLLMFGTASIDYPKFFDLLDAQPSVTKDINEIAENLNVDRNSLRNFFTGEISASLIDIQMIPNPYYVEPQQAQGQEDFFNDYTYKYREPKEIPHPRFMITIGLNDEAGLKSLMSSLPDVKTVENYYDLDGVFVAFTKGKMVMTQEGEFAAIVANGGDLGKFKKQTAADKTPLYGYVNTDVDAYPQGLKDAIVKETSEDMLEFFDEFESVSFTGSFDKMKFEVILKNKEENSLKLMTSHMMKALVDGGLMEELM